MKFRVIFLKKKKILYLLILLFLLIIFSVLYFKTSAATFNITEANTIKAELNGDGQEDIMYIKNDNSKYYIEVKTKDKTYSLDPDMNINTLGVYCKTWPMRINLVDISRDKVPEIFLQSSYKDSPLQHIFLWNGEKFENIFSSSNSILGFMDYNNNKTTKVISGNISGGKIVLKNYIFSNYKFYSYNYNYNDTFAGKDSILAFINYIQALPANEGNRPLDIFDPGINGKSIAVLGTMSGENLKYVFQDGLFMDTRFDKDGEISELKWILNFKGTSNITDGISKNYSLTLLLKPFKNSTQSYYYKITSIDLSKMGPQ